MTELRQLTFEDVLRNAGVREAQDRLERLQPDPATLPGSVSHGTMSYGSMPHDRGASSPEPSTSQGGCGSGSCGCGKSAPSNTLMDKPLDRRRAIGTMLGALAVTTQAVGACAPTSLESDEERETKRLKQEEFFKGNYRLMTPEEKAETVRRLERLAALRGQGDVRIRTDEALPNVIYGYAFNISKCEGYRNCVEACINENNLDRASGDQYIRIFEKPDGESIDDLEHADATYGHEVPAEGHHYLGTQCFQCANPPCVYVCPVQATWQEPDGIVVVDYDWCIGCRYCIAACPYWARRFNWAEPEVPADELNPRQHYLGNRARKKGVVEKCTFCIQRSREGRLPACAEACPTGARVFGNLLDPDSEIRWVLENKQVFRLKEDLGTEPRFWYFMD
jgi:molybdopterin-containing oxidoreductase family iron-sulfur binding subunit